LVTIWYVVQDKSGNPSLTVSDSFSVFFAKGDAALIFPGVSDHPTRFFPPSQILKNEKKENLDMRSAMFLFAWDQCYDFEIIFRRNKIGDKISNLDFGMEILFKQ
jgi:hypothetical protein